VLAANPIEVTIVRESTELPMKAIDELFGDAKVVYQDVCAVPALSPHSRFDMTDWRTLTPSLTHR
jgi:hypothetical protein